MKLMLSRICRISIGNKIPYWVFRNCECELTELSKVLPRNINMSISRCVLMAYGGNYTHTYVHTLGMGMSRVSDLRPISVTSILPRMVERLVVKNHIFLAMEHIFLSTPPSKLYNQFGFKPTGSTNFALFDTVSIMLETIK